MNDFNWTAFLTFNVLLNPKCLIDFFNYVIIVPFYNNDKRYKVICEKFTSTSDHY